VDARAKWPDHRDGNGETAAVDAGVEGVALNHRVVTVFRSPDDLADDRGSFHQMIEAVEQHLAAEHVFDL